MTESLVTVVYFVCYSLMTTTMTKVNMMIKMIMVTVIVMIIIVITMIIIITMIMKQWCDDKQQKETHLTASLILYELCIVLQYVYKPTRCTQFLWLDFIFQYTLYMLRTLLVHHQEQLYNFISCTSHLVHAGICRYVWPLCGYSHTTARRMVTTYTKCDVQLVKVAPGDGLI